MQRSSSFRGPHYLPTIAASVVISTSVCTVVCLLLIGSTAAQPPVTDNHHRIEVNDHNAELEELRAWRAEVQAALGDPHRSDVAQQGTPAPTALLAEVGSTQQPTRAIAPAEMDIAVEAALTRVLDARARRGREAEIADTVAMFEAFLASLRALDPQRADIDALRAAHQQIAADYLDGKHEDFGVAVRDGLRDSLQAATDDDNSIALGLDLLKRPWITRSHTTLRVADRTSGQLLSATSDTYPLEITQSGVYSIWLELDGDLDREVDMYVSMRLIDRRGYNIASSAAEPGKRGLITDWLRAGSYTLELDFGDGVTDPLGYAVGVDPRTPQIIAVGRLNTFDLATRVDEVFAFDVEGEAGNEVRLLFTVNGVRAGSLAVFEAKNEYGRYRYGDEDIEFAHGLVPGRYLAVVTNHGAAATFTFAIDYE